MLAIYKALKAMGAEWEVPKARRKGGDRSEHNSVDGGDGSVDSTSSDAEAEHSGNEDRDAHHDSASDLDDDDLTHPHTPTNDDKRASTVSENASPLTTASYRGRARDRYGSFNDWGYSVPQDPWIINARFRKDGMFPPGVVHPSNSSTNSSHVDLNETSAGRSRRSSTLSSTTSVADTAATTITTQSAPQTSVDGVATAGGSGKHGSRKELSSSGQEFPSADDCAWVYMTIQLYSIEKEFYLVDFKCAGYERLVRRLVAGKRDGKGDVEEEELREDWQEEGKVDGGDGDADADADAGGDWVGEKDKEHGGSMAMREEFVGDGRAVEEKDVSSPFPFLDVASRLIIQLAEAE